MLLTPVIALIISLSPAEAATSSTLNFQGRLLTNTGGLVADGSYNVEFNLYTVDVGGTSQWTETRLNSSAQGVTVRNGYFSVYLGDVTAFPASIDWDQEHWLGMTVRGTGSCAFGACTPTDAEMTPRFKLTAVPYAFRAGAVVDSAGNAFTGDDLVQVSPSTIQALNTAQAAIRFNQAGAGGFVQFQNAGTDVFTVDNNGNATLGSSTSAGQISLQDGNGEQTTLQAGDSTVDLTFTLPSNYGVDGQCLKTDGTGVLSFDDCPGGSYTVVKTVDESVTNSNVLQNDDQLTFAVDENEVWTVEYEIQATSNTTADYRFAVDAPAGSTCFVTTQNIENAQSFAQAGCGVQGGNTTAQTATDAFRVTATINVGATAGNVTLQWAQNTANAGATTVHAGSYLTAREEGSGGGGGGGGGGGSSFVQNGNAFGSTAILGTTDNQGLNIITNNTNALSLTSGGDATFANSLTVGNGLTVTTGDLDLDNGDITAAGSLTISSGGSGALTLDSASDVLVLADDTIQRTAAGTTTIDLLDAGGATTLSLLNSDGGQVAGLLVEGAISANSVSGDGSGLTNLDGSAIASGTVADARLSSNVALLNTAQTFTELNTFNAGIVVGNTATTTAGAIRWTGVDLEVFDGSVWQSLTGGGSQLLEGVIAFGKYDGAGGSAINEDGATVSKNSTGNYTVTFDSAAADANYSILLTSLEDSTTLDDVKIHYDNQTTAGFDVYIHEGDNGTTADVFVDRTWDFLVLDSSASAGGGGGGGSSFVQGGNAFGSTAILGTTDSNGLRFITNTINALEFTAAGLATFSQDATFSNAVDIDGLLEANNGIDITSGNLDLSNGNITGVNSLTATSFSGDGSSLTNLDGSSISSGTIADARLSANISRLDTAGTFTATQTFTGGAILGNFTSTTAGAVRWTGADFEGFDGTQWVSFTSGGSSDTPATATFYDSAGGATIGTGGFTTINLDATLDNSDNTVIDVASDIVTVQEDGYYEISYQVSTRLAAGTRSGFNAKLQRAVGAGPFSDVAGSQAFHYGRLTTEDQGTSAATVVLDLSAGDRLQIVGQGVTQSFTTVLNGSSLTVTKVVAAGSGGGGGGGGSSFEQNGNAFGATAILGTTDTNGLRFITDGAAALEFTAGGDATFSNAVDIDGLLEANNGIDITSGNLDLSNGNITGVNSLTATSFSGDGSSLTNLDGSSISSGTIADARLSANVALLNTNQTFTGLPTFSSGAILGNSTSTTAGAIRWNGTDFEGFDGIQWVSLTQGSSGSSPLLEGVLAFGKVAGATGNALNVDGATTARSGTGQYTVTLDTAATGADYTVQLTVEEDATTRDDINISLDNQTTAGFDVTIREGDNSTTADVLVDRDWHFIVFDPDAVAGGGGGGGTSFVDGGNAFGGTAVLGTTDTNGLSIITDNSLALSIDSAGDATFANDTIFNGTIRVGTLPTPDANAQASFFTGGSTGKGLVIQAAASQTANPFEIQDNNGNVLAAFTAGGGLILGDSTLGTLATASRNVDLPDASGTICLSGTDCGFLELASGSFATDATNNNSIAINKTGSGNLIALQNSGTAVFTVANTGSLQIQSTDSTALDIRNVGGSSFFSVDTSTGIVRVGPTSADANGVLFVLDTKNTAGDPTGVDGAQYYNSSLGKFRCFENGVWVDCINGIQLIQAYDNAGATNLNTVGLTALPLGAETRKMTGFTHDNITNNSQIQLDEAGWYRLDYNISTENGGNGRITLRCVARLNGTTEILQSAAYSYNRNATDNNATNTAGFIFETTAANEYVEVLCQQAGTGGTSNTIANESWVLVEKR